MNTLETFTNCLKAGDLPGVKKLVEQDPSLLDDDSSGVSTILQAMYYGQPAIAHYLVDEGALLSIFDAAALGCLDELKALLRMSPDLVNAFTADGFQALGLAAFFGQLEAARLHIEAGAEVNSASKNAMLVMPLHSAAAGGHIEVVRLLLEHGAWVNATQQKGFTPLHAATQNKSSEMVKLLLAHGADPAAKTEEGRTAADYADGNEQVISLLGRSYSG